MPRHLRGFATLAAIYLEPRTSTATGTAGFSPLLS